MNIGFWGLLWWGASVAAIGLVFLVIVIPAIGCWTKGSDAKTEFYSARASYWCVLCGLMLILAAGVGAAVANAIKGAR